MKKVSYHQLPLNIRLACIPLWAGTFSIFFYTLASKLSEINGEPIKNIGLLSFSLYLGVFFLLKRKKQIAYVAATAILTATTTYNLFQIYESYTNHASPIGLTVWWPLMHTIAFGISLIGIALPQSWNYYTNN